MPYVVRETHFSFAGPVLHNVGGIRCQPFLTIGNEHINLLKWSRTLWLQSNGTLRFS